MEIALDVDGVLAASLKRWVAKCNQLYGGSLKYSQVRNFNLETLTGLSHKAVLRIFSEIWLDYRSMPPCEPGLAATVHRMCQFGRVTVVTARSPDTVEPVKKWLAAQGIEYDAYCPIIIGARNDDHWNPKEDLHGAYDVFIDDNPALADGKRTLILRAQPWNQGVGSVPSVYRVPTLAGAIPVLKKISDCAAKLTGGEICPIRPMAVEVEADRGYIPKQVK